MDIIQEQVYIREVLNGKKINLFRDNLYIASKFESKVRPLLLGMVFIDIIETFLLLLI